MRSKASEAKKAEGCIFRLRLNKHASRDASVAKRLAFCYAKSMASPPAKRSKKQKQGNKRAWFF
jgi:hypothetical protein